MNTKEKELTQYIDSLGFQYFSGKEVLNSIWRVRGDVKNTLPPKAKWKNIEQALRVVDQLRGIVGVPITISSSYRSEKYNAACGGAKYSQHKMFKALDIQCKSLLPNVIHNRLTRLRNDGEFEGGLGIYRTFVHIDTRGTNADWSGV